MILGVPKREKIFIGGGLNGHVGKYSEGFERVHGGLGGGMRRFKQ